LAFKSQKTFGKLDLCFPGQAALVTPAEVKELSPSAHLGYLSLAPNALEFVLSNLTKAMGNRRVKPKAEAICFYYCLILAPSTALGQEKINLSKRTGPCYPGGFRCIYSSLVDSMQSHPIVM